MLKYTWLPVLCIVIALIAVTAQGERHLPRPVWINAAKAESGDWKWSDARKGSLQGSVSFSARRPNQPMVVYLLRVDGDGKTTTQGIHDVPERLRIGQKNARFDPGFAVMVRGQEVEFDNDETKEISHNVYFLGDLELDLGIFERGESVKHKFEDYGEISVHCSIHRRMDARLFIAPNPAYALLDGEAESYEIKDVPAGTYRLMTWQKQKRFRDVTRLIEIKEGEATTADVEMTR